MSYVFKTNRGDFLVANIDLPINTLPFGKEELVYVCELKRTVEHIVEKPEDGREIGDGIMKYVSHWTHLDIGKIRETIKQDIADTQNKIKDIEDRQTEVPKLRAEEDTLKKLEQSLPEK